MAGKQTRSYDQAISVLLVGENCSGKTAICNRYVNGSFNEGYTQTKEMTYHVKVSNRTKVSVFDVNGMGKDRFMTGNVYRGKTIILLVYDINNQYSVENLDYMFGDIERNLEDSQITVLVGTKCDLDRKTNQEELQAFAKTKDVPYYEVSAKTGQNIEEMFKDIIDKANINNQQLQKARDQLPSVVGTDKANGCHCNIT